jgi:hypothetical protein
LKVLHNSAILLAVAATALVGCGGGGGGGGGGGLAALGTGTSGTTTAAADTTTTAGATTTTTAAATTTTTGSGTPLAIGPAQASDIVDNSQAISAAAYRDMATKLSKDAGIAYRYGPATGETAVDNSGIPTLYAHDPANPLIIPNRGTLDGTWQIGGAPTADAGSYSTSSANLAYVADNPTLRTGVTDLQVSGYQYNTFAQTPQLSWASGGAAAYKIDSLNVAAYKAAGIVSGDPVAMGRCGGRTGFCSQSVVVYQNGVIGTSGSNTANNRATAKLPANKVPTGIAITNNNEFALVTVWDTTALKGQVAVVAMAGLCNDCDPYNASAHTTNGVSYPAYYDYWHEWGAPYPGLMNVGDIAFMKILGYVDLPGITAPTEIAVTTGMDQWQTMFPNGIFVGWDTPLTSQTNRQSFLSGGSNYGKYSKGGVAVVISKSEQKAAFIDLKPLFSYVNSVYFAGDQATFNNRMASLGQADNQWPYTFTQQPSQVPTVVKTVSLGQRPTAVKASAFGASRAWIATQDGTLHIYSLDGYANGGSAPAPAAGALVEVGTVTGIGRNPTSIADSKGEPSGSTQPQVLVNSRTDRKVSWVRFATNANSGSIVRTLQDTRLADPIAVEDADNFATLGYVVSVADHAGKALRNYRYGPVVFADGKACATTTSCPVVATGSVAIEYGGAMAFEGKPFQVKTANVP